MTSGRSLGTIGAMLLALIPALASAQTPGTWTLYPPQASVLTTAVRPPIDADGTSSWPKQRGVIPVQFDLFEAAGPVVFESIGTDQLAANDFSFLTFTPSEPLTFAELTELLATYSFTLGNCGGGSLRWSVRLDVGNDGQPGNDGSIFIYYGDHPNFTDCTTTNQSALNMIGQSDARYDTTQLGGPFYDTYANALASYGGVRVLRVSLVVDSGWLLDQRLTLSDVTVNGNTFVPQAGTPTRTCALPPAGIQVAKVLSGDQEVLLGPSSIQPGADDDQFRIVDCKYIYNLDVRSLGPASGREGTYRVYAVIGGPLQAPAVFHLR